jgi:tetratricopeptide (TPR) repeat protein
MRIAGLLALVIVLVAAANGAGPPDLEHARDRQDRAALERMAASYAAAAAKQSNNAQAQYASALVQSYLAEVATELRDKNAGRAAAETGIKAAEKAVALQPAVAEHHRILGTLCGQVIPANVLAGLRYGRCALDSINKAIELDSKSAIAYVSRGVGNYYLPAAFGGGPDVAIKDLQKAIELNPKLHEAHLWMGIALRKLNRNAEARAALTKALQLNPNRVWTKEQLEKTPAK